MAKKYRTQTVPSKWNNLMPGLCVVAFFMAVCLSSASSSKQLALVCVAAATIAGISNFSRLRERFHLPMLALALMTTMGGISTFYAVSGKFALYEFLKLLISFCLAIILLSFAQGDEIAAGRQISFVLEWSAALAGLISIDMLSTRLLSSPLLFCLDFFNNVDFQGLTGVEPGVRMTSLFGNPNVFAACVGIGVLLSLGLTVSAANPRERKIHQVCLFINALSFILAFSMGAIAFIAVAFLVYLAVELNTRRTSLFVLMVETLFVTLLATVPIAMTSFDEWDGLQIIPLLCVAVGAATLVALDQYVGQALVKKLDGHNKVLFAVIAVVLAAVVLFAVLAYNLTGGVSIAPGESLRRSAYPESGDYSLSAQCEGPVHVKVETQNKIDTMMHTSTVLYQGDLAAATFTVPEDSLVVYLTFSSTEGAWLESVSLDGSTTQKVPLGYKLLPGFIANRLQGLFANQNAIQRTVFFEDGIKIFARSPLIGSGIGCFENAIKGVQSFYYETKYAHNHYIQTFAETGSIGLVLFLGVLASCALAILLNRRKEENCHPLAPALAATLVFMAGHAVVEVDFSYYAYLPFAFGVFALISLCCGESIPTPWLTQKVKTYSLVTCCVLTMVFTGFLVCNLLAAKTVEEQKSLTALNTAIRMDVFERNDYMLSYVLSSVQLADNAEIQSQAEHYAEELAKVQSNTIPFYLADYYFNRNEPEKGMAMLEKYVSYVSSDPNAWEETFQLTLRHAYYCNTDVYMNGLNRLVQILDTWNAENLGTITLSEAMEAFLVSMGVK